MSAIAVNAMGGDYAPHAMVDGAHLAACDGIEVVLVGDEGVLRPLTDLAILHAPVTIDMHEDPSNGFHRSKESSIRLATNMVKRGEAAAVVDCGNTGVALMAATILLGRFKNYERPTIGAKIPRINRDLSIGHSLLLDAGANTEPKPSMMAQWGVLGSLYMKFALGIESPRVGLVSNGEEDNKGTPLVKEANKLLRELDSRQLINFIGNVQGGGSFDGTADVIVTDGFTGNALLKEAEVLVKMQLDALDAIARLNLRTKLAGMILKPYLKPIKDSLDKRQGGGSLLLGVKGVCIIGHGSSDRVAVANAIRRAQEMVDSNLVTQLKDGYAEAMEAETSQ